MKLFTIVNHCTMWLAETTTEREIYGLYSVFLPYMPPTKANAFCVFSSNDYSSCFAFANKLSDAFAEASYRYIRSDIVLQKISSRYLTHLNNLDR